MYRNNIYTCTTFVGTIPTFYDKIQQCENIYFLQNVLMLPYSYMCRNHASYTSVNFGSYCVL